LREYREFGGIFQNLAGKSGITNFFSEVFSRPRREGRELIGCMVCCEMKFLQACAAKASFHKYQNAPYQTDWAVRENQLSLLAEFLCANSDAGTIVPARNLKDRKTTLSPSDLHFLFYTKVLFSLGFRKSKDPTHPPIHMMSSRLGVVSEG